MQRGVWSNFSWNLYMAGTEFSNTYLTVLFILDDANIYKGSPCDYMMVSLSKMFPGGLVDKYLQFGEWYGNELSDKIGIGYGLAGNLITESLVYGGKLWCIINPLLIGSFLLLLNKLNIYKNLLGFLYILILCITMQNITRSYFYGFVLYPLQILFFPLFWSIVEIKKKLF
jgi:hypothetical protein